MKRVHPSEVGATDLGTFVRDQEAAAQLAAAAVEQPDPQVWLWKLFTVNEQRRRDADYMGVHTTAAGAWLALKAKAIEVSGGALSLPEQADIASIAAALDAAGWVELHSVASYPLVTP